MYHWRPVVKYCNSPAVGDGELVAPSLMAVQVGRAVVRMSWIVSKLVPVIAKLGEAVSS